MHRPHHRRATLVAATSVLALALAACGSGSTDGDAEGDAAGSATDTGEGASAGGTFTFWDPYPQFSEGDDWPALVQQCGDEAGVTIDRSGFDTTDLANQALLAGQQGNAPDVLVVDNPVVSTLADAGVLTTMEELGLGTDGFSENILDAGVIDGSSYGVPIGANTLALYYNADVLDEAGVDPESITDWDSLTSALEAVDGTGNTGITFSAIGTEEGSFQFLPWFWGGGGELTELAGEGGVAALQLWTDWVDAGLAPNSVINNTQTTTWQEFESGSFAFGENGTWQLGNANELPFEWGVIPIPAQDGGAAPAPTGGEFVAAPVQEDSARYDTTSQLIECLTSPENLLETDTTLSYIAPIESVQETQVEQDEQLEPWVEAVREARGRTGDGLGTDYPVVSQEMWDAVQNALSGSSSPEDALQSAQDAAGIG